jgi:hypothetical protein
MKCMKTAILPLILVGTLWHVPAFAGGDCFKAEILDFRVERADEYRLALRDLTGSYGNPPMDGPFVVHLRHDERTMGQESGVISRAMYLQAVQLLDSQIRASRIIQLCVLSNGFDPIEGTPGEFQSNSATIVDGKVALIPHRI